MGVPVFPANDENELIEIMTLLLGPIPKEMILAGKKKDKFYQLDNDFKLKRSRMSRV